MKTNIIIASVSAVFAVAYLIYAITTKCKEWSERRRRTVIVAESFDGLRFLSFLCACFYAAAWVISRLPHTASH